MRLPRPWDSPGKNTGVGCHFLLQCRKVKSESEVAQSLQESITLVLFATIVELQIFVLWLIFCPLKILCAVSTIDEEKI